MNKAEFLDLLRKRLAGLPEGDIEERLAFYGEMIEDRMEEGQSEADAVAAMGDAEEIAAQIIAETPFVRLAKERIKPKRRLNTWEIVLLAVGSPIWLSLAVAALAVVLSLYVALWSVVVSLWAAFGSFIAGAAGGVAVGCVYIVTGNALAGLVMIGAGLVLAGLAILFFFGCKAATKGAALLAKGMALGAKRCLLRRREGDE